MTKQIEEADLKNLFQIPCPGTELELDSIETEACRDQFVKTFYATAEDSVTRFGEFFATLAHYTIIKLWPF